ncbi:MAG: hypothetical protein C0507_07150 [Cyanobacteria bacterium PR.3.49]|nr:hypothetical protein [Cyanobacteria bacterium PR.3.49]
MKPVKPQIARSIRPIVDGRVFFKSASTIKPIEDNKLAAFSSHPKEAFVLITGHRVPIYVARGSNANMAEQLRIGINRQIRMRHMPLRCNRKKRVVLYKSAARKGATESKLSQMFYAVTGENPAMRCVFLI